MSGMKMWSLAGLSTPLSIGDRPTAPQHILLLSDKLMCCCAASTNGCLDLRLRAFPLRCPGSMGRRARDGVAPLQRSSAGWMPASIGRLSVGIGRSHPVKVRRVSLVAGSMRRV